MKFSKWHRPRLEWLEDRVQPDFLAPLAAAVGTAPQSVAVGDFNGDGVPDLAVANRFGLGVSVLLGNGDGSFQPARNFSAGNQPTSVAVGDFNGDGVQDLVVANGEGNDVSVLLGNGDGTFQAPRNYSAGIAPRSVAVGDFRGNGILDLAVADGESSPGSVSILLGNGDGTFQAPQSFDAGGKPTSVAVGDFRGNGILDLAVTTFAVINFQEQSNVSVLLGNGDGTFQAPQSFNVGSIPVSVAVGDFRGNGIQDLAVVNAGSNSVSMLLGNGDGSFQPAQNYSVGINPNSVAVGDFNGDGIQDLAAASGNSGTVSVLLGNGDGSFQAAQDFSAGTIPVAVAVGDFNGDGAPDLAVANTSIGTVSALLNDGAWPGVGGAPAGSHSRGAHPRPRTPPAGPDLVAKEVARLAPSPVATVPPPGATVPLVPDSRPLPGADAAPGGTRAAGAAVSATRPPALDPFWARAAGAARLLLDRLFAEPESHRLGGTSADEPWWSAL
jgi:hypothetical protein